MNLSASPVIGAKPTRIKKKQKQTTAHQQ